MSTDEVLVIFLLNNVIFDFFFPPPFVSQLYDSATLVSRSENEKKSQVSLACKRVDTHALYSHINIAGWGIFSMDTLSTLWGEDECGSGQEIVLYARRLCFSHALRCISYKVTMH